MSRSRLDEQCDAAYASDAKAHKRGPTSPVRGLNEAELEAARKYVETVTKDSPRPYKLVVSLLATIADRDRQLREWEVAWSSLTELERGPTRHWEDDPLSHRCPLCGQALPRLRKAEPWERACLLCGGPRGT